ncbi:MAG: hypothetical protein ACLFRG_23105, partial [Desulfococcaceae bacterium]
MSPSLLFHFRSPNAISVKEGGLKWAWGGEHGMSIGRRGFRHESVFSEAFEKAACNLAPNLSPVRLRPVARRRLFPGEYRAIYKVKSRGRAPKNR